MPSINLQTTQGLPLPPSLSKYMSTHIYRDTNKKTPKEEKLTVSPFHTSSSSLRDDVKHILVLSAKLNYDSLIRL